MSGDSALSKGGGVESYETTVRSREQNSLSTHKAKCCELADIAIQMMKNIGKVNLFPRQIRIFVPLNRKDQCEQR